MKPYVLIESLSGSEAENDSDEAATVIKFEFNATFDAVTTGARSMAICEEAAKLDEPSFIVQLTLRWGWLPVEESVPVS